MLGVKAYLDVYYLHLHIIIIGCIVCDKPLHLASLCFSGEDDDWRQDELSEALCILQQCVALEGSLRHYCISHTCSKKHKINKPQHKQEKRRQRHRASSSSPAVEDLMPPPPPPPASSSSSLSDPSNLYAAPASLLEALMMLEPLQQDTQENNIHLPQPDLREADLREADLRDSAAAGDDFADLRDDYRDSADDDDDDDNFLDTSYHGYPRERRGHVTADRQRINKRWQYTDPLQVCIAQNCPGQRGATFYQCVFKQCIMKPPAVSASSAGSSSPVGVPLVPLAPQTSPQQPLL